MFLTYGVKSVTMDDIAQKLHISKRTLYELFGSKKELVNLVVKYHIDEHISVFNELEQSCDNAIDLMIKISKFVINTKKKQHISVMYELNKFYPDAQNIINNFYNEYIEKSVKDNIKLGIEQGLYRSDINAKILSNLYIQQMNFFVQLNKSDLSEFSASEIFDQLFSYHMYGIMSEKGIKYYLNK